jgi:hypothetical protein
MLKEFYEYQKALCASTGQDVFEIVFASSDYDEQSFDEYYGEMPWLSIPFKSREAQKKLSERFSVRGIPALVFISSDGSVISTDGRGLVMQDESGGFLRAELEKAAAATAAVGDTSPPELRKQNSDQGRNMFQRAISGIDAEVAQKLLTELRGMPTSTVALKTLNILVGNICKAPAEEKYRSIKLTNPKIQQRLCEIPQALQFLCAMGFREIDGVLSITEQDINTDLFNLMSRALGQAVEIRAGTAGGARVANTGVGRTAQQSWPKKAGLSLKQQAMRGKADREKGNQSAVSRKAEKDRQLRAIAADKFVRKNDPNWKPKVSAAMAKNGTAMQTFRDKFGEDQGGG